MGLGVIVLLVIAGAVVIINGNNRLVDDGDRQVTESTVRVASEPPLPATTIAPATTVATTTPPTVPPTVAPTTVVPTTVAPTAPPTVPLPPMIDVADATGTFVVQLPADFQTNVQPVTISGTDMSNVTGATDLTQYLAGDFSVVGATVLAGPTAQVGSAGAVLADFDPGDACTLTDFESSVDTTEGRAVVLSYDDCGDGQYALVLLAVEVDSLQQTVFVGVQDAEPSWGSARDLAIAILQSFRPA